MEGYARNTESGNTPGMTSDDADRSAKEQSGFVRVEEVESSTNMTDSEVISVTVRSLEGSLVLGPQIIPASTRAADP